jgi:hypothetical protein
MHRREGVVRDVYYGFDSDTFYLRLDFAGEPPPGADLNLTIEFLAPRIERVVVHGLAPGARPVTRDGDVPVPGAVCAVGSILELGVPFRSLGYEAGEGVELILLIGRPGEPAESVPSDDLIRFVVPHPDYDAAMWSA